jgi:hypothetical protein
MRMQQVHPLLVDHTEWVDMSHSRSWRNNLYYCFLTFYFNTIETAVYFL